MSDARLTDEEVRALRPGVNRNALEELLGAIPNDLRETVLFLVSTQRQRKGPPPLQPDAVDESTREVFAVAWRAVHLQLGDAHLQTLYERATADMR